MRITILRTIIFILLFAVIGALVFMQLIRGNDYYAQSRSNRIRVIPVDAPRGIIVDRHGEVLADNRLAYHLAIIDQDTDDKEALFQFLGKILNRDPRVIASTFAKRRITPFAPVLVAQDIPADIVLKIEENRFQYPGLMVMQGFLRRYPKGEAFAHSVGYVGKIDTHEDGGDYGFTPLSYSGRTGIEKSYDEPLRGESGGRQIEINARGQQVRTLSIKEPQDGHEITLTLDAPLTQEVQRLFDSRRGAAIVMDVTSGEVITLVSSPSFNPNAFVDKRINDEVSNYFRDNRAPMLNRAVKGQFPPGSVFKIPVALASLQLHKIMPSQTFDCPGYFTLGGRKFACAHTHGRQDLLEAIAHSCNVYFFHVGQMLGPSIINAYAKAFGLNRPTGIDLPFESSGHLRKFAIGKKSFGGDVLNLSIGQGDTLSTPIQITVLMGALATDGVLIKPRLIKAIDNQEEEPQDLTARPRVKLRSEVWRTVKEGMRQVVNTPEGTGRELNSLSGLDIWGKTGTAQAGRNKENHAWFAGFVKGPQHTFAFCVFLEHGGSSYNAVVLTKDILAAMQSLKLL